MEIVLFILVLCLLAWFALPIVAIAQIVQLRRQLQALQQQQKKMQTALARLRSRRRPATVGTPAEPHPEPEVVPAELVEPKPDQKPAVDLQSPPDSPRPLRARPSALAKKAAKPAAVRTGKLPRRAAQLQPEAELPRRPQPTAQAGAEPTPPPDVPLALPAAKPRSISLEERLGAKLPVWLGAIALLLAGVFLVAFAVKRGWFTPRLRVYASAGLGTALIAAGLGLRSRYADIAQGLGAAGVGICYAVILAMATIFQAEFPLVTTLPTLYMIVGLTALAIALSLHLGPLVAVIGLLGGFLTPALIGVGPQDATPLFLGLLAQQMGTSLVGRRHARPWFALAALLAVEFYVVAWMLIYWNPLQAPLLGGVVLAGLVSYLATLPASWDGAAQPDPVRAAREAGVWWLLPVIPAILLSSWLMVRSDLNWINVALHAAQLAGLTAYAGLQPKFFPLFTVGAGITLATVWQRAARHSDPAVVDSLQLTVLPGSTLVFGAILGLGSIAACWAGRRVRDWSLGGAATLVGLGVAPFLAFRRNEPRLVWLVVLFGLLGLAGLAASCGQRWRRKGSAFDAVTLIFLAAGAVLLLLATQYGIKLAGATQFAFAVGAAVTLVLSAAVARGWQLPAGRWLALAVAGAVALGTVNGATLSEPLEPHLLWNRATLGFAAAILGLIAAGVLLRGWQVPADKNESAETAFASWLFAAAAILTAIYLCVLVRHGFARWATPAPRADWLERATDLLGLAAVAWLLMLIARGLGDRLLRRVARWLAIAACLGTLLGSCAIGGPLANPIELGDWPLLNWLSYTVALPLAVVGLAIWSDQWSTRPGATTPRNRDTDRPEQLEQDALWIFWGATVLAFVLLQVRQGFWRGGVPFVLEGIDRVHLYELPIAAVVMGSLAGLGAGRAIRTAAAPWQVAAVGGFIGFSAATLGIVSGLNPLLHPRPVGAVPIWNGLWIVFALPAMVAAGLAIVFQRTSIAWSDAAGAGGQRRDWPRLLGWFRGVASVLALLLVWLFVTAEVRQYFVGAVLPGPQPEQTEWYVYSAAWIVLAIGLLAVGVGTRSSAVRWGSLVLMLLSVGKVFLLDTRHLGDLWRVASYLGLGLSLMLVAFVYQRFVFREARGRPGDLP